MKRAILLSALACCGCSTAPVADLLDWTVPGKAVPKAEGPPPESAPPPLPPRLPAGPPPGDGAPPLPPPPVE